MIIECPYCAEFNTEDNVVDTMHIDLKRKSTENIYLCPGCGEHFSESQRDYSRPVDIFIQRSFRYSIRVLEEAEDWEE